MARKSKRRFHYEGWVERGRGNFEDQKGWYCYLDSLRCIEHSKSGRRCSRRTVIGTNICWQHLLYQHNLKIKKMRHGLGLFAYKKDTDKVLRQGRRREVLFRPGDKLIGYGGHVLTKQNLDLRYGDNVAPYVIKENNDSFIDAACNRSVASIANHGTNKQANTKFTGRQLRLEATKNIKEGDEIIVNYHFNTRFNQADDQGRIPSTNNGKRFKMRHRTV